MADLRQDVLRLQPHMIPALRATFESATDQVDFVLQRLRQDGVVHEPWLGDEVSADVAAHYTRRAMNDPDSSLQALVAYRNELARVHDTLARMEDEYRRREGENVSQWGRLS